MKNKDMKKDVEYKGTIELGTSVMVSDPGYDMDVSCKYQMDGTKAGTWKCFVFYTDNGRSAKIVIMHNDYEVKPNVLVPKADIGVDSGMAGFFDFSYFKKNCSNEDWYSNICDLKLPCTVDNKAFISVSGYGDGSYKLYIGKNDSGEIVSAMVVFLTNKEADNISKLIKKL